MDHDLTSGAILVGLALLLAWLVAPETNPRGIYFRRPGIWPREQQLLQLYDHGLSDRQCADMLSLSPYTVRDTKQRLFAKTGAGSKAELMKFAHQRNLLA